MLEALPCSGAWSVAMRDRTTFRVGGAVRALLEPATHEELLSVLRWAQERSMPIFVLGRGSNLVVSDHGWDGAVIAVGQNLSGMSWQGTTAHVMAGTRLTEFVMGSVRRGLGGQEKLSGIPGSVGGAVVMDAGAYGEEFGSRVRAVTALSFAGEERRFSQEDCAFGYRTSFFHTHPDWIVLGAELELLPGDPKALKTAVKEAQQERCAKQPLDRPSAGSLFKRPPGGFAAKLIDEAGLKGFHVGDAAISEKHAGFAVNLGKATAQDVWDLSCAVQDKVREQSGITLEREVVFLGKF